MFMKQKILLAMSGGVDSSAAIVLLKQKYEVIGVTFKFYRGFDVTESVKVAQRLEIEHHVVDRTDDFTERVIRPFCDSYIGGLTPNPCAVCNRVMKFPAIFDKADELGCEFIATGHYALSEGGVLKSAVTSTGEINPKDQSYMLYALTPGQLSRIVFPLSRLSKAQVRAIALEYGLSNAGKPDSQDICFVPDGDYAAFIERFTGLSAQAGDFIDTGGKVIASHRGHIHYTPGQRRGLGISGCERLYVIGKDADSNTVTVGKKDEACVSEFNVNDVIWHVENPPTDTMVKIRYGLKKYPCTIKHSSWSTVNCQLSIAGAAPGQCAVFYDGDAVIGGGIICQ
jgi:tRNA-specific 2-thiouridylase